jgi:hypothetical protein
MATDLKKVEKQFVLIRIIIRGKRIFMRLPRGVIII